MKKTTKVISIIIIFFIIIISVVVGRTMIGNHFKKKFSKRPPPSIIVSEVIKSEFSDNIESFGTALAKKTETFKKIVEKFSDAELVEIEKKND